MARGDISPSEKRTFEQPETGARVLQLTDQPCSNGNAYYNHEQFINGSERLVFRSDRSGERQLYSVDLASGQIVQLTEAAGMGGWAVDAEHDVIYYSHNGQILRLDPEALTEEVVADTPPDCSPIALQDLSSCGRFLVLSARPGHLLRNKLPPINFRHGSENLVILCDTQRREQAVVYHGPTPEVPVAADSHLLISRGDPSYVWFGSYTRMKPTGFKTAWVLECDLDTLMPTRDPRPLFDQRPNEFINHYYPAPDAHAQMPLYVYSEWDRDGVPIAKTRSGAVSRAGNYHPMMLDVDLVSGTTRRYLFPGQPPSTFRATTPIQCGPAIAPIPASSGLLVATTRRAAWRMPIPNPARPFRRTTTTTGWSRVPGSGSSRSAAPTWRCAPSSATTPGGSMSTPTPPSPPTTSGSSTAPATAASRRCSSSRPSGPDGWPDMTAMAIRPYRESDQQAVVDLWEEDGTGGASHNDPLTAITAKLAVDRELFLVAVEGEAQERIVGTVIGGYDGHRGWVYSLVVDVAFRRRGIATQLMERLEELLKQRGCLKVNLQVRASNEKVVALYKQLGYEVEARVSMGKRLYEIAPRP